MVRADYKRGRRNCSLSCAQRGKEAKADHELDHAEIIRRYEAGESGRSLYNGGVPGLNRYAFYRILKAHRVQVRNNRWSDWL